MSTDATVAQVLQRTVTSRWRLSLSVPGELRALFAVLVVALVARLIDLREIEPNVLPDEADHLTLMYRILAGFGPGPFDLSWDGNPAFSLYPALPFVWVTGGSVFGLRIAVALAGTAMLAAFYAACRQRCSALAAITAAGLLAFSQWSLFFSRNGEVNIFVALYAMLAVWSAQRALDCGSKWAWVGAGFWAGMGWYGFLGGVLILPCLLAPALVWLWQRRREWRGLAIGIGIMVLTFAATVAPRVPALVTNWESVTTYVGGRAVSTVVPAARLPETLLNQALTTVRAFLLFDPTLEGNPRYMARGRAVLDAFNASLFVLGLLVALRRPLQSALWLSFLLIPIATTQILTTGIPDLARAIIALPAYFLIAALAVDRLAQLIRAQAVSRSAAAVAVVAVGWWNWQAYNFWMDTPAAAIARDPALEYDELTEWHIEQQDRVAAGLRGLTVNQWREQHPRPAKGRARGSVSTSSTSSPRGLTIRPGLSLQGPTGQAAIRGVAVVPDGPIVGAEPSGRLFTIDPSQPKLIPLQPNAALRGGQIWDVAADDDGTLFLIDSERGQVFKVSRDGEPLGTFGADWGMYRPRGLAVGPDGLVYIADTGRNRVVVSSPDGRIERIIGPVVGGLELEQPTDVAVGLDGRTYVALPEASRIEVFDRNGRHLTGWRIAKGNTIDSPRVAVSAWDVVAATEPLERRVRLYDREGRELGEIRTGLAMPYGLGLADTQLAVTDPGTGRIHTFEIETR